MNPKEFKKFINTDEGAVDKSLKCKNIDEFKKIANENRIDYTDEELNQAWSYVQSKETSENGELSDDALDSIAGGTKGKDVPDYIKKQYK